MSQRWGLVAVRDPEEAPRIPEVLPSLYVPSDTAANGPSRSPGATATCTPPWSMRDSSPRTIASWPAAPFTLRSTNPAGVRLQPNGDFRIDDVLTPAPAGCASPVLLIRNTGGAWFAAGIEDLDD